MLRWIRRITAALVLAGVVLSGAWVLTTNAQQPAAKKAPIGYDDTPTLPGQKWRVHDINRPRPRVVEPGTCGTPDQPCRPPSDAIVLFDGKDLSQWQGERGGEARWKVENGYMEAVRGTGSIVTRQRLGTGQYHAEWASPVQVVGDSQGRGNSGFILMSRYEIQVLDSYGNVTYADGQAGAIYGQWPPLVNVARKPGEWQSYDVIFEAPRFDGGKLAGPAYVTVLHNGVVVHHRQEIIGMMAHRVVGTYSPHGPEEPLMLQEHGNPTRYRNVWYRRLGNYDEP